MTAHERWLKALLRIVGAVMLSAFVAVVLPTRSMAAIHEGLGIGAFPRAPLVEYLTRSASALYGIHGGLLIVLASDVTRFAPVIRYLAAMNLVLGVIMTVIDLIAPMPLWWTLSEGPPIFGAGLLVLYLVRRTNAAR